MTRGQKAAETRKRNQESMRRMEAAKTNARAVVATGICPQCGKGLRRNLSMTGWWQCEQYGSVGFRKDGALSLIHI